MQYADFSGRNWIDRHGGWFWSAPTQPQDAKCHASQVPGHAGYGGCRFCGGGDHRAVNCTVRWQAQMGKLVGRMVREKGAEWVVSEVQGMVQSQEQVAAVLSSKGKAGGKGKAEGQKAVDSRRAPAARKTQQANDSRKAPAERKKKKQRRQQQGQHRERREQQRTEEERVPVLEARLMQAWRQDQADRKKAVEGDRVRREREKERARVQREHEREAREKRKKERERVEKERGVAVKRERERVEREREEETVRLAEVRDRELAEAAIKARNDADEWRNRCQWQVAAVGEAREEARVATQEAEEIAQHQAQHQAQVTVAEEVSVAEQDAVRDEVENTRLQGQIQQAMAMAAVEKRRLMGLKSWHSRQDFIDIFGEANGMRQWDMAMRQ